MAKVLIVEDDAVIAQAIAGHIQAAGFDAVRVDRGNLALARLRFEQPDVCVLDLMLPGLDGWKLIETVRNEGMARRSWSSAHAGQSTTACTRSSSAPTTTS